MRNYLGPIPTMSNLDIDGLYIDSTYQRNIETPSSQRLIRRIADEFSWRKFQPLTVACTEDETGEIGYSVVDGQHRLQACKLRGDITEVPCYIITADEVVDQAQSFTGINKNRVAITPVAMYHAELAARDPKAVRVQAVCEKAGILVHKNQNTASMPFNRTIAVGTLKTLSSKKFGEHRLSKTLEMLAAAGDPDRNYLKSVFIKAVFTIYRFNFNRPKFSTARLIETIQSYTPPEWEKAFKAYKEAVNCDAISGAVTIISKRYNHQLRTGKLITRDTADDR